jgi:hypothetical protein
MPLEGKDGGLVRLAETCAVQLGNSPATELRPYIDFSRVTPGIVADLIAPKGTSNR